MEDKMKNNSLIRTALAVALGLWLTTPVFVQAETGDDGDDTMIVFEADERPADIDNLITLPERASETGVERSRHGLETANEARGKGREFGMERAMEARGDHMGNI
jgi:hypothetical protein